MTPNTNDRPDAMRNKNIAVVSPPRNWPNRKESCTDQLRHSARAAALEDPPISRFPSPHAKRGGEGGRAGGTFVLFRRPPHRGGGGGGGGGGGVFTFF